MTPPQKKMTVTWRPAGMTVSSSEKTGNNKPAHFNSYTSTDWPKRTSSVMDDETVPVRYTHGCTHSDRHTLTDAHTHTSVIRAPLFLCLLCPVRQKTHYWLPNSLMNWDTTRTDQFPAAFTSWALLGFPLNWSGAGEQHLETGATPRGPQV